MRAILNAGGRVRGGFMHWLKGAPSHVLAELLQELERDGWRLVPKQPISDEAVERGARAIMAREADRVAGDRWDESDAPELEECRADARAVLQAAASPMGMAVRVTTQLGSRLVGVIVVRWLTLPFVALGTGVGVLIAHFTTPERPSFAAWWGIVSRWARGEPIDVG
jgi:hypothetical protein